MPLAKIEVRKSWPPEQVQATISGHSMEAKRALYKAIVTNLAPLGFAPSDIFVVLHEIPLENWGIRGRPASEIDRGFKVNV